MTSITTNSIAKLRQIKLTTEGLSNDYAGIKTGWNFDITSNKVGISNNISENATNELSFQVNVWFNNILYWKKFIKRVKWYSKYNRN